MCTIPRLGGYFTKHEMPEKIYSRRFSSVYHTGNLIKEACIKWRIRPNIACDIEVIMHAYAWNLTILVRRSSKNIVASYISQRAVFTIHRWSVFKRWQELQQEENEYKKEKDALKNFIRLPTGLYITPERSSDGKWLIHISFLILNNEVNSQFAWMLFLDPVNEERVVRDICYSIFYVFV
uniref:Uncharacterized protein n=1 Tax=Parascaris equorum TaxID=6256 RepID=A0A914SBL7_PAREQ